MVARAKAEYTGMVIMRKLTLFLLGDEERGIAIPPKGAFAELFGMAFQEKECELVRRGNIVRFYSFDEFEINREKLGALPGNVQVYPYVDQLAVFAGADVFITHCGMNSVSESLYMAAPLVLYPQTGEQQAVARRVTEIGAGTMLQDDSSKGIRAAVQEILNNKAYGEAAAGCSADFRACFGAVGAADFIEKAPHV